MFKTYIKNMVLSGVMVGALSCRTSTDVNQDEKLSDISKTINQLQVDKADSSTNMEDLKAILLTMRGQIEETQHRQKQTEENFDKLLGSLEQRLTTFEDKISKKFDTYEKTLNQMQKEESAKATQAAPSTTKTEGDDVFKKGVAFYEAKQFDKAAEALEKYVESGPKGKQATQAYVLLGNSFQSLKDYDRAINTYQTMREKYPKSSRVPEVIFEQAECFSKKGDSTAAKAFYLELVQSYNQHHLAKLAKKKLKSLP